jgi:hypothetical protein
MLKSDTQDNKKGAEKIRKVFYEKDRFHQPGQFVQRRFKDPLHFLHNLLDLLTYTSGLVRVYLGRSISPRFREMIMLTVASANDCNF